MNRLARKPVAALASAALVVLLFTVARAQNATDAAQTVPFERYHNRIYLRVSVNGSQPLWFALDSGASRTVIDEGAARRLGLKLSHTQEVSGFGAGEGKTRVSPVEGVTFSLGGVAWQGRGVLALPLDYIEPYEGHELDGVIGFDFFSRRVVEVDYARGRVAVSDPRAYTYDGAGAVVPVTVVGGWAFVNAKITTRDGGTLAARLHIDSGARGWLALSTLFVEKNRLLAGGERTFPGVRYGVGGESPELLTRVRRLQFGSVVIEEPVAAFSRARRGAMAGGETDGTISGSILSRFSVTFDYARRRMIFEPAADSAEPYEYDMSGMLLKATGDSFETKAIYRVFPDSPAADAGLREGDRLEAVDGRPASQLTLEQIELMFRRDGEEHTLTVRRDGARQIKLKTRRLV